MVKHYLKMSDIECEECNGQNFDVFENDNRERLKCKVQKRLGCDKEKLRKESLKKNLIRRKIGFKI